MKRARPLSVQRVGSVIAKSRNWVKRSKTTVCREGKWGFYEDGRYSSGHVSFSKVGDGGRRHSSCRIGGLQKITKELLKNY